VIVMKKLSEVVNVVPVIAKSDSLTSEEREGFKLKVCHLNTTCLGLCSYFSTCRSEKSLFSTTFVRILLTQTRTMKKRFILTKVSG
jgi:hypothetical protein